MQLFNWKSFNAVPVESFFIPISSCLSSSGQLVYLSCFLTKMLEIVGTLVYRLAASIILCNNKFF